MEETIVQVDNIEDQRDEKLLRIGDKYQAEIPSFRLKFNCNYSPESPDESTETHNFYKCQNDTWTELECQNDTWTKLEVESLMLGLYIFGKNFSQLKRFIGSKTIGEVQFFYYAKFYKSEDHKRWHAYKKAIEDNEGKGKLMSEPTHHQQILRHLLNNESEEWCNKIFEVCKNFWGGKLPLEDYVFALKDVVGVETFVDAVGIGKQNDPTNLEGNAMKSIYEILEEKDFSKITSYIEIVHILSGDFRISKTQASDIFWEAVWPRLLANGWHSEQPRSLLSNRSAIIFIVPGIEEYSRNLVKGVDYFDSIKYLLDEVAAYPLLIKDPTSKNDSDSKDSKGKQMKESDYVGVRYLDKGSTSGASANFEKTPSIEVSPKETTIDLNIEVALEEVDDDETMVNEVPVEVKIDEPNDVTVPTSEDHIRNQAVETPRKSRRPPKPTKRALEAVVDKYEEETSNKRRRM